MSITASSLLALVEARGAKEATAQLLEVGAASDTAGTRMKAMAAGGLLVAGAALIGVGALSVKMGADFQQSTNLLITSAGEIPGNIDMIRKGLLAMSVDTATPVDELTKGMFNIESAGYHGAAGLAVEKAAAEGAKVENADLASTTDVLTTAMHNYHEPTSQAVDVMNSFRLSASIGKMRMDDLTGALRNVLPIASQAGVKLSDVEAALSTMSLAGDKGASAGTHLAQMFTYLLAPSSKAKGALKEVGLTTQEISDEMKVSLPGTVQMITDAVGQKFPAGSAKYLAALSAIVGGNKSMKAMLELSGISLKTFTDDAKQLGPTMTANSTAVDGWTTVQGNFNFKMQAAKDAVDALMITLGTKLLPIVGKVADAVTPLITGFSDWIGKSNGLSGAIDQVSSAFQQVFDPVKKIVDAGKPLLDTFDRATSIFAKTNTEAKPLMDTFDRGKSIMSTTNAVAMPLFDTFDRATSLLPKTTDAIKKTNDAVSPLVALFKDWKPVIEDVFKDVETLAGDILIFGTGIADAADKSGFFQSALRFLHDELPVVGSFLVNVGGDINANLLPPLESLITNVGSAAAGFITWADKSGYAKAALSVLEGSIQLTTQILGPLIQAVSSVVGWLGGGGAGTDTLVFALSAAATAFTLLKIADTATQFGNFVSKLQEGDGVISNLALSVKDKLARAFDSFMSNQAPHLKASMDSVKASAEEAAVAEEEVAAAPADASAAGWFAKLETELEGVGTTSQVTAGEVAASSAEMDTSLEGVGAAADAAKVQIASIGPATAATGTEVATTGGGIVASFATVAAGITTAGVGAIVGIEAYMLKDATPALIKSWQDADFKPPPRYKAAVIDMENQSHQLASKMIVDAVDMKNAVTENMTTLAKQVYTETSAMSANALNNFKQLNGDLNDQMQSMDANVIGYWNDIADYISSHQITGTVTWVTRGAPVTPGGPVGGSTKHFAAGTDYAPGGMAMVGEHGPEMMYVPQGARIIPNDQLSHGGSGWGGSNSQPMHVHVHIADQEFDYLTDAMMDNAARKTRLRHGRRAF